MESPNLLSASLSPSMVEIYQRKMTQLKATRLLSLNISALLRARGNKQKDLSEWCHHSEVWLSKFLKGDREMQLKDLDRVADFFGLATYQLFQPGIASSTERRSGSDRRTARERRIGQSKRLLGELADTIDAARAPETQRGRTDDDATEATPLRSLVRDFERRFERLVAQADAGRQDSRARAAVAPSGARARPARRRPAAKG